MCSLCDFTGSSRYLKIHQKRMHSKVEGLRCEECEISFDTSHEKKQHMQLKTHEKIKERCDICDKMVINTNEHKKKVHHEVDMSYQCEFCDYTTNHEGIFQNHVNSVHLKERNYPCQECGKKLATAQSFKYHMETSHPSIDSPMLSCQTCGFETRAKQSLSYHIKAMHDKKSFVNCEVCGKSITKGNIQAHMKHQHSNKSTIDCEYCHKSLKKHALNRHLMVMHKVDENGQETVGEFTCNLCTKQFPNLPLLQNHSRSHTKPNLKNHSCDQCDFKGDSSDKLTKHINQVHLGLRPFSCTICKASFKRKAHLEIHQTEVHSDEQVKKFMCDKCDFKSSHRLNFVNHVNAVHLGIRPYKCESCEKTFTQRSHLNTHKKSVHLGLKPLKCKVCDKDFSSKPQLILHEKGVHKQGDYEFKCDKCNFKTHYRDSLKKHTYTHGEIPKPHACKYCGKRFITSSKMKIHCKNIHEK